MTGTRKPMARWRRIKHVAMVLCVQSALVCMLFCGVLARATDARGDAIEVSGASIRFMRLDDTMRMMRSDHPVLNPFWLDKGLIVHVPWQWPRWMPERVDHSAFNGPGWSLYSWELTLPLWPVPVALGAMTWYANRRIKRLQRHGCDKCGYDTRGLAAGAP
ncbi:MAG TPA: hypothetical protein VK157_08965, partial [Phycisphaerales bacterium]|nr:hypothetical protein [Phycisphaerales bacterium]